MDTVEQLSWLARRVGLGLRPGQLDSWDAMGIDAVLERLLKPGEAGLARRDPFAGLEREFVGALPAAIRTAALAWMESMVSSPRDLENFLTFFWHDYFAVSARIAKVPGLMFDHINLLARHALGDFSALLRDVTIDGAMLVFLNGDRSKAERPNENYGRELLELYSVGVGNFTETDVSAAARALTGWKVTDRAANTVNFRPGFHDDTRLTVLGHAGVHDVDSLIDAVLASPATSRRVVHKLATVILGEGFDESVLVRHIDAFASSYQIRPVVRGLLEDALDGAAVPTVIEPVPWFVAARRATGAVVTAEEADTFFAASGQQPLLPPNVGGYPKQRAYFSAAATVARFNMASRLAERSAGASPGDTAEELIVDTETMRDADLTGLAQRLGVIGGFQDATKAALAGQRSGSSRLAVALAAPELLVV